MEDSRKKVADADGVSRPERRRYALHELVEGWDEVAELSRETHRWWGYLAPVGREIVEP